MAGRVYRPYSIISRMLFDLEALDRVPAKHFYPWMKSRKKVGLVDGIFRLRMLCVVLAKCRLNQF